jgi:hypothetical protein
MDFFVSVGATTCIGFPVPVEVALALSTGPSGQRIKRVREREQVSGSVQSSILEGDEELLCSQVRFYPAD